MFKFFFSAIVLLSLVFDCISQTATLKTFPLADVRLLNSPFKQAQETDKKYILSLNVDRLLAPFLKEAGIETKAISYPNWENSGLDGHIGGHYLSALANMYAATGDAEILRRLTYMIDQLEKCQQKDADGYVGGIPGGKKMWNDVAAGKINAGSFSLNEKWVPLYNIHKLYAGLIDAYNIAGNQKAKTVLIKLSDWFYNITAKLSNEQLQTILRSEHGGMNEAFADVAAITGDKKYLELAKCLSHQIILNPLLQQKDALNGLHANTQIPKVIGFMRIAEITGDSSWANAANFFWNTVVTRRTISIGGNSVREHFHPANDFSSMIETKEGPETCNSYNMLKLSKQLFLAHPSSQYTDYYERTMYNHILSSQHPNGGFVYFTPIRPRHYRVYSQPQMGMWCCVGTGMENHGKYGELIYAHNEKDLYVNFFIPSILNWKEKGLRVEQLTAFPNSEETQLKIIINKPQQFAIVLRYPSWLKDGKLKAYVNKKEVLLKKNADSYVSISRTWKTGDVLSIQLPMEIKAEFLPDSSSWVSFVRGPIVLAAATDTTGTTGLKADDSRMGHIANGPSYSIEDAPMIITGSKKNITSLKSVTGKAFTYTASDLIYPAKYKSLQLVPFYTLHDTRYMLYWRYATPAQLESIKEEIRKKEEVQLVLEKITVDQVAPGEQQPESDHNFKGEQTESGVHKDRHWRTAKKWFSYELKNTDAAARILRITYFGQDRNRLFDIYVNNVLLQTVELNGSKGDQFFDVDYELPAEVAKEKLIAVKFVAKEKSTAGGIYYVRLVK
ncbi:glycoside hydrolase family 127 protein [Lacibacter sediminis]|uniref:Glycoside hydrolase family 127 protein n=1 Tax=Lacibacter sediminis TaxID=2760713 RepID=A0A7G5XLA5_9BACT|nr:glycoside hydrolase family 127 protein [Lacibacter sediminis]QNA46258.1 glycoside hydrolase family 127 protein [Lacibacter sediminis]